MVNAKEATVSNGYLDKVWEIRTLRKPMEETAKALLEKVSKQVEPLMRRRKWRVHRLSEFCPKNPNLLGLNINRGKEVKIRLRRAKNEDSFFPYEHVLGTMLHELAHIQCGPHNSTFFKLLDELQNECDQQLFGNGMVSGRILGGNRPILNVPPDKSAAAAALKREMTQKIMPVGPQRLGGDLDLAEMLSPHQAAAMAAERRCQSDLWCAGECTAAGSDGDKKAAEVEDMVESSENCVNSSASLSNPRKHGCDGREPISTIKRLKKYLHNGTRDNPIDLELADFWQCEKCTLANMESALCCDACGAIRSMDSNGSWKCSYCTLENDIKSKRCSVCDQWRYSIPLPFPTIVGSNSL